MNNETVDPSVLKNVAGNEASLDYENNTATTVNVDGTSRNVKEPYVMASFASFDTEHPKIIKVNNDKGMNQDARSSPLSWRCLA